MRVRTTSAWRVPAVAAAVLATLLVAAPADAQPGDAAPADAGPPDAGVDGDAGIAAPVVDAGPTDDVERRAALKERELAEQTRAAALELAEATSAAAAANAESEKAATAAQLLLADERAKQEATRAGQAQFRRAILAQRATLVSEQARLVATTNQVDAALARSGELDATYDLVAAELARVLADAWHTAERVVNGPEHPPSPPPLASELEALPAAHAAERDALVRMRAASITRAVELRTEAVLLRTERIDFDRLAVDELAARKVRLMPRLSASKRRDLRYPDGATMAQVRDESLQIGLQLAYWLHLRYRQIGRWISEDATWLSVGDVLWSITELLLLLGALLFARRRWDAWMNGLIAAAGRSLHLGSWPLLVARFAELARQFGPPLLVTGVAALAYLHLGGANSPAEVQVGFIVVFWLTVLRGQLRFVESLARFLGTRSAERAMSQRELEAHDLADPDTPRPTIAEPTPDDVEPTWITLSRTWRMATRYLGVVILVLALLDHAVGRTVTYGLVRRAAWWGSIPIVVWLLRIWRPRIVHSYLARSRDPSGVLARLANRHGGRFYGVPIVAAAFVVVLVQQTIAFVRRHLSNLDSTKRLLAWLFRRRVEKHAQEHGRVLDQPHDIPPDLSEHFPTGPLEADGLPRRQPCLDELAKLFETWKEHGSGGSVAIVGSSGMGKSSVLKALASELEEPVMYAKLITKVTEPEQLLVRLSRLLELGTTPTSELELIGTLRNQERRIIAVDNAHNLFLRQVGGFRAWEAFTRIVNETSDKVFWVVTFNDIAWQYLNNIAARLSYFRTIIKLPPWTDREIRQLILQRTRRARYRLNFTDLLVSRIDGASMSSQIIGTSQGYFRLLWDFTNGNPRDACHFWLRSLVPDPEHRRVRVHLFAAPRIEELQALPDDIVFVLQAVAEHQNLTADELCQTTNMSLEFCRFALRYCREAGYLWRDPSTGRSELSIHWHQTVIRYLKRQHLIYS